MKSGLGDRNNFGLQAMAGVLDAAGLNEVRSWRPEQLMGALKGRQAIAMESQ